MKKTLKSGATLDITRAPFVVGHKLFKTILKEMKSINLKLGLKEGQTLSSLATLELTDDTINTVKDAVFTLLSSQEIEDVLWECMPRVLYDNKKVDKNLFENEKAQEDYYEIAKEVMVFNLSPFRKSLESLFPRFQLARSIESQP